MIRHYKSDDERAASLRSARKELYNPDGCTFPETGDRETDGLLEIIENLLGRVRALEDGES